MSERKGKKVMTNNEILEVVVNNLDGPFFNIDTKIDVVRFTLGNKRYRVCFIHDKFCVEESKGGVLSCTQEAKEIQQKLNKQTSEIEYQEALEKLIEFAEEIAPGNKVLVSAIELTKKLVAEMNKGKSLLQIK